jgi:hypothetical protein
MSMFSHQELIATQFVDQSFNRLSIDRATTQRITAPRLSCHRLNKRRGIGNLSRLLPKAEGFKSKKQNEGHQEIKKRMFGGYPR